MERKVSVISAPGLWREKTTPSWKLGGLNCLLDIIRGGGELGRGEEEGFMTGRHRKL